MKTTNKISLLTILLSFSSFYSCNRTGLLSSSNCAKFTFEEEMQISSLVFIGSLIAKDDNNLSFQVIKSYKGKSSSNNLLVLKANLIASTFKLGDHLLVFSDKKEIHKCSRTKKILFNSDFEILETTKPNAVILDGKKYRNIIEIKEQLQNHLIRSGNDNKSTLSNSEIEFLIPYLDSDKTKSEFENKNILFVTGPSGAQITNKESYFKSIKSYNIRGLTISNKIIWLNDDMKIKSGGYDAIITYWVKYFSNKQLTKTIKKAQKFKKPSSNKR